MYNEYNKMQNIDRVSEKNYSIASDKIDIWNGSLPYNIGCVFPPADVKERADISKTNRLIYNNDVDEIYNNLISIFPETDPMYGFQIREIVTNLPYFKNATNAWVGLVAGDIPLVDTSEDCDSELSSLVENSNFNEFMQNEVRSRFTDIISAYLVDVDLLGNPYIVPIESKNLICFVNKQIPSCIEVNVVFSIYKDNDNLEYIDFVEYHYNGLIRKHTMKYNDGIIGEYAKDIEESYAFNGKYKESPLVVFKHNAVNSEIYGTDQYRYWCPSMLAGMRELQNVLRLGEKAREIIRKVPNSAIKKQYDGSNVFLNRGTIGYDPSPIDGRSPDVEYITPKINMDEAVNALDKATKQIAVDTQLGLAFYNIDALGSRLSAESIRASMYPARLEALRMTSEMKPSVKELIYKLCLLADLKINKSKLSIQFYDGFPKDEGQEVELIQRRLNDNIPSITLEDALIKLDRVSLRVAKQKAEEIMQFMKSVNQNNSQDVTLNRACEEIGVDNKLVDVNNNIEEDNEDEKLHNNYDIMSSNIGASGGVGNGLNGINKHDDTADYTDNTVWDNQFLYPPRDTKQ